MNRSCMLVVALFALSPMTSRANENWPQFRGTAALGTSSKPLPVSWDQKRNVAWQVEVPGHGWSSPVVWGDKVFVTAVLNDKTPKPQKGLYINDLFGKIPAGEHVWKLYCFDFATGKLVWDKTVHQGIPAGPIHLKNTYASETCATDGVHVVACFGNLGMFGYDFATGKEVWKCPLPAHKTRMGWGTSASPVIHKDRVLYVGDNEDASYMICLDKATGKQLWKIDRAEKSNWGTPLVWENAQRTEIVVAGTPRVHAYDLDGKPLWEFRGMSSISIPTPFATKDMLYVTSGYVIDPVRPLYAIKPGATGDISLKPKETSNEHILWCQKLAGPYHPTPVLHGGHIYVLLDRGFLSCYDVATGKEVYAKERIEAGSDKFTSSPWAADGKIYCLSEDGETYIIKAGPKFEVLAKNSLQEMALATPALVRGDIVLRTATRLYRISAKKE